jgi:excisionase family DNA binding protein
VSNTPGRSNKLHSTGSPGGRRYITQSGAAEYLGVTTRCIRQMIADGRLTGYRSGTRLVRVDLNEIDAAMQPFGGAA